MAIALPGEDRVPPGNFRDFIMALHGWYDRAGRPGARTINLWIRQDRALESASHETISSALRGASLPSWAKTQSIAIVLVRKSVGGQYDLPEVLADIQRRWLAAQSARPSSVSRDSHQVGLFPADGAISALGQSLRPPPLSRSDSDVIPRLGLVSPLHGYVPDHAIVGDLPERNVYFIGREILIQEIRERLGEHAPIVLFGPSGVGKTQLAREYIYANARSYRVICWVQADQIDHARASLLSLAETLQIPPQANAGQTVMALIDFLESGQVDYLLVFDGADDVDLIQLMPGRGGHLVVTTQNPALANDSTNVRLDVPDLELAEAVGFLRRHDPLLTDERAEVLVAVFGKQPLALEQIAALRQATRQPWEDLAAQITKSTPGVLGTARPAHYAYSITASVQLALSRLRETSRAAASAIELFAWLGREPVSVALLVAGQKADVFPPLARVLRDPIRIRKAIAEICRYGLARLHLGSQRIEVQPLKQLALREVTSGEARDQAQHNVHAILAAADPGWPDDQASWNMHREMAAHILPSGLIDSPMEAAHHLVVNQIRYRYLIGDIDGAARLGQEAVTKWKANTTVGPDHELVLLATLEWANALRETGRFQRARELTAEARQQAQANPESVDDHPLTLSLASGLAADQRIAGNYDDALRIDQAAFDSCHARWGEADRRTEERRHSLSTSLRLVGDFSAAANIDSDRVERNRRLWGESDNATLLAVGALSEDLCGLGRYQDVLELPLSFIGIDASLGPIHQRILLGRRTAALAMSALGQWPQSLESLESHYLACRDACGPDHRYTLAATMSYANSLRRVHRAQEAYVLAAPAVATYQRLFGARNPLTLAAEVNLATIVRALGQRVDARNADVVAEAGLRAALGDRHPYLIAVLANLGTDKFVAGDFRAAAELSERAYLLTADIRGGDHPETLMTAANLSIDRASVSARAPVGPSPEAVTRLRQGLGDQHPLVAQAAAGHRMELDIEPPSM